MSKSNSNKTIFKLIGNLSEVLLVENKYIIGVILLNTIKK